LLRSFFLQVLLEETRDEVLVNPGLEGVLIAREVSTALSRCYGLARS
jgi:hypothetical protein